MKTINNMQKKDFIFLTIFFVVLVIISLKLFKEPFIETYDSSIYISGAKNIIKENCFCTIEHENYSKELILKKITHWQSGYSYALTFISKILNIDLKKAAKFLNIFCWFGFHIIWLIVFLSSFSINKIKYFSFLLIFLPFVSYFSVFLLSDTFFWFVFSIICYLIYLFFRESKQTIKVAYFAIISFLFILLFEIRYVSLAFIPPFLLLVLLDNKFKYKNYLIFLFIIILISYFSTNVNNASDKEKSEFILETILQNFSIEKIFYIFSFIVFESMGLITFTEGTLLYKFQTFAMLLLIPLIFFLFLSLKIEKKQKGNNDLFLLYILSSLILYTSGIVISYMAFPQISPISGLLRYFAFLLPMIYFVLLHMIMVFYNHKFQFALYTNVLFLFLVSVGNILRFNHIINNTLPKEKDYAKEYYTFIKEINSHINNKTIIYSNIPPVIYANTDLNTMYLKDTNHLKSLIENKSPNTIIAIWKNTTFNNVDKLIDNELIVFKNREYSIIKL
ncbi:MAG: hypothetical protein N2662_00305 [Bacteroidales bacterium]|nr:hypothetical protein [Bacteroidales bacterium]